ncbi:glutathione ABC transporter substrate-binding protein [Brevibacillus nitrificans]|uniref:glutathione ABC transporter substrate-binding protein n=1 Tax=Brevibacillus nitrificans TaxID=651560 RepID=UPI002E239DCF|nr:glutathione ABC transporter substrate-binding protein [Brevibacillus nitrificans]
MKKKWFGKWAAPLVLAVSLLVSACGTSETSTVGAEVEAKDLVVGLTGDPVSLDPHNATDTISSLINYQILDTLVAFNDKMEIVPRLAESWTVSEDGKTWTFKLRQGVTFQDGTPFNAEAVKTNFERLADKSKKLSRRVLIGQFIDKITTNGDYEVVFQLNTPQGPFLNNLAVTASGILSPKSIKENEQGIAKNPVGTGPFTFKEWTPGNQVVLEANQQYWGGKPGVKSVTFKPVPENAARVIMLETGEADVIEKVPASEFERLKSNDEVQVISRPTNRVLYIGINTTVAPFDQVKVRQALNYAIDRETLVNKLYEGRVKLATASVAAQTFGYSDVGAYPYDVEKAKSLLQEAGVKEGTKLRLILAANVIQDRPAAEFVQNSLQKVGFDAELKILELGSYLETLKDPSTYDLFVRGAAASTGDADSVLSDGLLSTSATNYSHYANPKVDEWIKAGSAQTKPEERQKSYAEALKLIKEEAPWISLHEDVGYVGIRKNVEGVEVQPTYIWDLRKVVKK